MREDQKWFGKLGHPPTVSKVSDFVRKTQLGVQIRFFILQHIEISTILTVDIASKLIKVYAMLDHQRNTHCALFVRAILISVFICACSALLSGSTYAPAFDPWQSKQPTNPDPPPSNSTGTVSGGMTQEQIDSLNRQNNLTQAEIYAKGKGDISSETKKQEREFNRRRMEEFIAKFHKNIDSVVLLTSNIKQSVENNSDEELSQNMIKSTNKVEKLSHQIRELISNHKVPTVNITDIMGVIDPPALQTQNDGHQQLLHKCTQYLQTAIDLKQAMDRYLEKNNQNTVTVEGLQTITNNKGTGPLVTDVLNKAKELEILSRELTYKIQPSNNPLGSVQATSH